MKWELIIHLSEKYVEVKTHGTADYHESIKMAKELKLAMKSKRIKKALIDHRDLVAVSGEVYEIYERPKLFRLIGVVLGIKVAELIKEAHSTHFNFLEIVCNNNGFTFSTFYEKEKALEWLLEK